MGVGLSMDAFAVSICKGLSMRKVNKKQCLVIGLFFGGFQALMPFIGWVLGSQFEQYITSIDHWIAFILLGFIGGKMAASQFRLLLISVSKEVSYIHTNDRNHKGRNPDDGNCLNDWHLQKCKCDSNGKSIDAGCDCQNKHLFESSGGSIFPTSTASSFSRIASTTIFPPINPNRINAIQWSCRKLLWKQI